MKKTEEYLALAFLTLALALALYSKYSLIFQSSPTFEEPHHIFQSFYHQETGQFFSLQNRKPAFLWLLAKILPHSQQWRSAKDFTKNSAAFVSSYQYRIDELSGLPQDQAVTQSRLPLQIFWIFLFIGVALSLRQLKFSLLSQFLVCGFLLLDPVVLSLTSLLLPESAAVGCLALAIATGLFPQVWLSAVSLLLFSAAWALSGTALLALFPLGLLYAFKKPPRILAGLWLGGAIGGGLANILLQGGWDWNFWSSMPLGPIFLDGVEYQNTPMTFFLQLLLSKMPLALVLTLAIAVWTSRDSETNVKWWLPALSVLGLLSVPLVFRGAGLFLILPIYISILILAVSQLPKGLLGVGLLALLCFESFLFQGRTLAYQNLLAGNRFTAMESGSDWGQGLSDLALWAKANEEFPLGLSLFGGTPPETYGIKGFRSLPSFPSLRTGEPLQPGDFSGFVAVSENFINGHLIREPELFWLKRLKPVRCFQGALCLFDLRSKPK